MAYMFSPPTALTQSFPDLTEIGKRFPDHGLKIYWKTVSFNLRFHENAGPMLDTVHGGDQGKGVFKKCNSVYA